MKHFNIVLVDEKSVNIHRRNERRSYIDSVWEKKISVGKQTYAKNRSLTNHYSDDFDVSYSSK